MKKKVNPTTKVFRSSLPILLLLLIAVTAFSGCLASGAKEGDTVLVHYTGTLDDGTVFETNVGDEPVPIVLGQHEVIPGFENALYEMKVNQTKKVVLQPEEAYPYNPDFVIISDKTVVDEGLGYVPQVGEQIMGTLGSQTVMGSVIEVTETSVVVDFNSPVADKVLTFEITVAEIQKSEAP